MLRSADPLIAALIADLDSPSARVAESAALKLARAQAEEAIPALLRTLANATDATRAHAAAEALAGLRVGECVPLILEKIDSPVFAGWTGSLVYHAVELDCRAHLDRLATILVRDGSECCALAYWAFKHRRGPLAVEIERRCLRILGTYSDEYQAGGHRGVPSQYHPQPHKRWQIVAGAHDLVVEWNERERRFPRQGENRSTGGITPDWTPISTPELQSLIERQLLDLDAEDRSTWRRIAIDPPTRIAGVRQVAQAAPEEPAEAYVVGREGDQLLLYDDVQDVFATSRLEADGSGGNWSAESEDLELLVHRFQGEAAKD